MSKQGLETRCLEPLGEFFSSLLISLIFNYLQILHVATIAMAPHYGNQQTSSEVRDDAMMGLDDRGLNASQGVFFFWLLFLTFILLSTYRLFTPS